MGEKSPLRDTPWKRLALCWCRVSFPGWMWLRDVGEAAAVRSVSRSWRQQQKGRNPVPHPLQRKSWRWSREGAAPGCDLSMDELTRIVGAVFCCWLAAAVTLPTLPEMKRRNLQPCPGVGVNIVLNAR